MMLGNRGAGSNRRKKLEVVLPPVEADPEEVVEALFSNRDVNDHDEHQHDDDGLETAS